jgi:signal peptidase
MKKGLRLPQIFISATIIAFSVLLWLFFAPTQFGGRASYIIIHGQSMLPNFKYGDLAIVQQAESYKLQDIVAYRHPQIGTVFHRIISSDGKNFTLRGDNNDYNDPYFPTQDEIIGKLWIHIPGLGKTLEFLRQPTIFTLLVIIIGIIGFVTLSNPPQKVNKLTKQTNQTSGGAHMTSLKKNTLEMFYVLIIIAVASMGLGIIAYTRPPTIQTVENLTYEHSGIFSYTASASGNLYDQNTIKTGEPIFRKLTDNFSTTFNYQLLAPEDIIISGSYSVSVEISSSSGWKRTIVLQESTSFTGTSFSTSNIVDLNEIQFLIDTLEEQTGVRNNRYFLSVVPEIKIEGSLTGVTLKDSFSPALGFQLDSLQLQLLQNPTEGNALETREVGAINYPITVPNNIRFLSLIVPVNTAQLISLGGLLLSTALMFMLAVWIRKASRDSSLPVFEQPFQSLIIPINKSEQILEYTEGKPAIEITSLEDLARIAERSNTIIARHNIGNTSQYYVIAGGILYHFEYSTRNITVKKKAAKNLRRAHKKSDPPHIQHPPIDPDDILANLDHKNRESRKE